MTSLKTVKAMLAGVTDTVSRQKDGTYIARRGFFYTGGKTSEHFAAEVARALPVARVIDHGEHWADFRGGASVAKGSHFWATFSLDPPARPPIPAHHAEAAQQEADASDYATVGSML